MATPTWVADGGAVASAGVTSVPVPAGIQNDDILIMLVECTPADSAGTPGSGDGWAHITGSPRASNFGGGGTHTELAFLWKRTDGTESSVTLPDPADHFLGIMAAFRGCITTGDPWDVVGTQGGATNGTRNAPTVNTTVDNTLVLAVISVASTGLHSGESNSNLTNLTERIDVETATGNNGAICLITGELASLGATGATTTSGGSLTWIAFHIALKGPGVAPFQPQAILL